MSVRNFYIMLLATNAIAALILLGLLLTSMADYVNIGWIAMIAFSLLSILIFNLTNMVAGAKRKSIFLQVIMFNMMGRLVLSAFIAAVYYKMAKPEDGIFIVPFLIVYVIFTIFETYFMDRQTRL